jgi:eukaryotic-like serine/threonine-protein kinase
MLTRVMAPAPGITIGAYRLEDKLGEGGMGAVYRAIDTRLNRAVAIKFLSNELADPPARRRFQREAQLASSLNHPHILTVHDAGEFEGRQYLVTEIVDGGTLRDWMAAAPRGWDDVVELLVNVADALATAHEAGILHRDIKPENILITRSGYAKLADFGLAKLCESGPAAPAARTETHTRAGLIAGTTAYMSPEQAKGQPLDARGDVFSFAVVVYEMLSGRRPFTGATELEVLHAIAYSAPARLAESIPAALRAVLERALQKDKEERLQSMREFAAELRRVARRHEPIPAATGRRRLLGWAAGAILAIVATTIAIKQRSSADSRAISTQYIQLTNYADSATSPALSPDGKMVTFIRGASTFFGPGQIYVKALPDGEPRQLTNDPSPKMGPQFTPDGARISYTKGLGADSASMDTWTVSVSGGPPKKLLSNAEGLTWYRDGAAPARILFSEMTGLGGQMSIVAASDSGMDPRIVYAPPPPDGMAHRSYLSPDGRWLLVVEMDSHSWLPCRLVPFDASSTGKVVGPAPSQCTDAAWSPDGRWMYFTAMTASGVHIWRQRFPQGTPEEVTSSAVTEEGIQFAPNGRSFVTSIGTSQSTLWVHDARGDRQITSEGNIFMPAFSPDGRKIYYLVRSFGLRSWNQGSLWVADLDTGHRQRLLPDFQVAHYSISADGRRVVFVRAGDDERSPVWLASLDGIAPPRQLTTMDAAAVFFGAPGEVLFGSVGQQQFYVYRVTDEGRGLQKVAPAPLLPIAVSPDGRFIAVQDPAAWGALIVQPADGGAPVRLCDRCAPPWGTEPIPFYIGWAPNGESLYWTFTNSTYAIPLESGQALPSIPATGIQSAEGVRALRGARLISDHERTYPGPDPSLYAFISVSTQRNIYRVPVR